jgi:hypothetical protein
MTTVTTSDIFKLANLIKRLEARVERLKEVEITDHSDQGILIDSLIIRVAVLEGLVATLTAGAVVVVDPSVPGFTGNDASIVGVANRLAVTEAGGQLLIDLPASAPPIITGAPTLGTHAAPKSYVDAAIAAALSTITAIPDTWASAVPEYPAGTVVLGQGGAASSNLLLELVSFTQDSLVPADFFWLAGGTSIQVNTAGNYRMISTLNFQHLLESPGSTGANYSETVTLSLTKAGVTIANSVGASTEQRDNAPLPTTIHHNLAVQSTIFPMAIGETVNVRLQFSRNSTNFTSTLSVPEGTVFIARVG